MADTIRTRAAILALLADNNSGNISAQDLRDAIVSIWGVMSSLYVQSGSTPQSVGTTPAVLQAWATAGPAAGLTPSTADNKITIGSLADGTYLVLCQLSYTGNHNTKYKFTLVKTSVAQPFSGQKRNFFEANLDGVESAIFFGLLTAVEGDTFQVNVEASADSKTITVVDGQFICFRVY